MKSNTFPNFLTKCAQGFFERFTFALATMSLHNLHGNQIFMKNVKNVALLLLKIIFSK